MQKKIFFLILGLILIGGPLFAQRSVRDTVPLSSKIVKGVLSNGLTYYVMHNEEPKERADFYIIRKVGAIVEEENENGLAHFLEHMAFNGTKNFPEKGIINMLERHGVDFGRSINAFTGQNQTVYTLFNIPTTDSRLIDSSLLVLHDWSHYLSLTEKEINAERGVILEEWRTGENSEKRIRKTIFPYLFNYSKYAERDVIGDTAVILNFKPETIRNFYNRWYRPDLEAIAIVGDIDPVEIENKIRERFSSVPMPEHPQPFPEFIIKDNEEPYFVVARDKEETNTAIQVYRRFAAPSWDSKRYYGYIRDGMVESLVSHMVRNRISSISQKPESPFIDAGIGVSSLVPGYDIYVQSALSRSGVGEQLKTVRGLYTLHEQMVRYGFDNSELDAAKADFKAGIQSRYNARDKKKNNDFIKEIIDNFLEGEPLVELEDYYDYVISELDRVTLEDAHSCVKRWDSAENMVVVVTIPEKSEAITREMFFTLYDSIRKSDDIAPYLVKKLEGDLIDGELPGSEIVKEKELKKIGATMWRLDNGATVVYKHADYDKDQVNMLGSSIGGSDRYALELLPSADFLESLIPNFGLGKFSREDLRRKMAGTKASVEVSIGRRTDHITGHSVPKDFEALMKLTYLKFEHPRFDTSAYEGIMEKMKEMISMKDNDPISVISDSLSRILSDNNPRVMLVDEETLSKVSLENVEKIYRERFSNASDYSFVIVGNVAPDTVRKMVSRYIGSISSQKQGDRKVSERICMPSGNTKKVIPVRMEADKAYVFNVYSQKMRHTLKRDILNTIFKKVLDSRYFESMREKEGGTYGVSISERNATDPESYGMVMSFECAAARSGRLNEMIRIGLDSIEDFGPRQDELDKIVESLLKERQQVKENNSYVMNRVLIYLDRKYDMDDPKYYEDIVRSVTVKDIQKFAARILRNPDTVNLIFVPADQKNRGTSGKPAR